MKHYLITGGAGFIGSQLIRSLFKDEPGIRITCIDNFDPFYSADLKQLNISEFKYNPSFRFLVNDLAETTVQELNELIEEPVDIIVHLAAKAGVRPSLLDPLAYQKANVIGLQHLLDFAKDNKIRQFVFASSSSVYGINENFPWKEDERLLPISPYAMTKLAGEMMGHVYSRHFDIRFIALRFFTVYGPGQRPDLAIHKFTKAILNEMPVTMYGEGNTSRDYTYVNDIVQGVKSAIKYESSDFEIFNLGNNYTISLKDLVTSIEVLTGKKAIIEKLPEQPGDLPKTFADISKARNVLGYAPQTDLQEGLKSFYEWFTLHKEILIH